LSRTKAGLGQGGPVAVRSEGHGDGSVHAAGPVGEQSEVVAEQKCLVHMMGDKHGGGGPFPQQGAYPLVQP